MRFAALGVSYIGREEGAINRLKAEYIISGGQCLTQVGFLAWRQIYGGEMFEAFGRGKGSDEYGERVLQWFVD